VVLAVYLLAMVMTEIISNNAVGVIFTPVAIELGHSLGVDPRGLVQTNMLVYGPGGYRFSDYLKVGIPLNLLLACTASLTIPLIWPL